MTQPFEMKLAKAYITIDLRAIYAVADVSPSLCVNREAL
jgi:hypothetical protein